MNNSEAIIAILVGLGLIGWIKILTPYKCENKHCGYWTFNRKHMFHHVQQKHYHKDS